MAELGVLTCPVCDRTRLCRMDQFETQDAVKECATDHLRDHHLDESKRGIYRVKMAWDLDVIDADDGTEYPLGDWAAENQELSV